MLYDRARIFVQGGGGGNGCLSLPARGPRPARRPRRRRRRARGRRRPALRRLAARPAVLQAPGPLQGRARAPRPGRAAPRGRRGGPRRPGPARHPGHGPRRRAPRPRRPRPARGRRRGRPRRPRQQALRGRRPPGAALRRARTARGRGLDRAAPQAPGRRRPRRAAQRGQVLAAGADDPRHPEGRRLPLHDARARAGHDRRRRAPARPRRHPRADRGRQRGCRASATTSWPTSSARGCWCTSLDLAPARRLATPSSTTPTVERELAAHAAALAALPRILVLSPRPTSCPPRSCGPRSGPGRPGWAARSPSWRRRARRGWASTSCGASCSGACPVQAPAPQEEALASRRAWPSTAPSAPRPAARFRVERLEDGTFRVAGEPVERLIARHDLENEDALVHVERRLHRMGVVRALEAAGFQPGDDVEIGGVVFELDPG